MTDNRIALDPEDAARGLTRLVLALVDLLRQVLERQALRRVESGALDDEEIERLGQTFLALQAQMDTLRETFGLTEADLALFSGGAVTALDDEG